MLSLVRIKETEKKDRVVFAGTGSLDVAPR